MNLILLGMYILENPSITHRLGSTVLFCLFVCLHLYLLSYNYVSNSSLDTDQLPNVPFLQK